jgi:hypothetical protein
VKNRDYASIPPLMHTNASLKPFLCTLLAHIKAKKRALIKSEREKKNQLVRLERVQVLTYIRKYRSTTFCAPFHASRTPPCHAIPYHDPAHTPNSKP